MASLSTLVAALEQVAPLAYAEPWDNVGLLIEPPNVRDIGAVMLTIDLTEPVFAEAMESGADAIIAYHPPIFGGLKSLRQDRPLSRTIIAAIQAGVPIYSPHTALDAVEGGMNDWLASGLGRASEIAPIKRYVGPSGPMAKVGGGRQLTLADPASLTVIVETMKTHLGLKHVRVAAPEALLAESQLIKTAAVCPGSGGGLFAAVGDVDLLVTGEMTHHDVLARVASGTAVMLTDHTNTERGYLPQFKARLSRALSESVEIMVSKRDADPLRVR